MAYGDYDGPNKLDKGKEGGSCNRTLCQASPAVWFNHGSRSWYCSDCRVDIESANRYGWQTNFQPKLGYPMFETIEMINQRKDSSNGENNV